MTDIKNILECTAAQAAVVAAGYENDTWHAFPVSALTERRARAQAWQAKAAQEIRHAVLCLGGSQPATATPYLAEAKRLMMLSRAESV